MKVFFTLLLLFLYCSTGVFSQEIQEILQSGNFIWGRGEAITYQKADKMALDDLISKISVEVQSDFVNMVVEENDSILEYTKAVVRTYSNIHLYWSESKVEEDESQGLTRVYRFIKKDNLHKIFDDRKTKIIDYAKTGYEAETELRLDDALRNYYWALVLLRSHPEHGSLKFKLGDHTEVLLSTRLYDKINQLLSNLDISIYQVMEDKDKNVKTFTIKIDYDGKPIEGLDYQYFSGNNYTEARGKDGFGVIELFGASAESLDKIRVLVEYQYTNKCEWDSELSSVINNTPPPPFFRKSEYWLRLPDRESITGMKSKKAHITYQTLQDNNIRKKDYRKTVNDIIEGIQTGNVQSLEHFFTWEGYEMFIKLVHNGNVKVLPLTDTMSIIEVNDEVMVRSVPMLFAFQNNTKKFLENVVFIFNKDQKIDAISFALSDKAIGDIANMPERWGSVEEKYQLIKFMEYYKTAYSLKRLDYIESIFADDALIIVGHVLEKAEPIDGMYMKLGNDQVKYIRRTKKEYMESLRKVFISNEFVNIQFEGSDVERINDPSDKLYGIQIEQHYYSANYADKGFLFLLIDLNDTMNPKIYVRSWQPQKNPNGSIIGLSDFHF
ncbi:MAG: LPP20 family lipoprotein [Bacteroidetes bacterium]|nr:LPP20 family lipoprotein [Bacteroidota bacterium]